MKTVFINISLRPDSKRRQLPVGLAYVMTAVRRAGFEFDLIDMDINGITPQGLKEILMKKTYDVYAFGCIVTGFKIVKNISGIIRAINPNAVIIAGNSVASSIPEILLRKTNTDIAIIGEGDVTVVELLRALESKKDIGGVPGMAFKRGAGIIFTGKRPPIEDINDIEFPDWDIFELDKYEKYGRINTNSFSSEAILGYPLNSARGCPFNCTFCYHVFKTLKYRKYSEGMVIEEIKRLNSKYRCNYISFWDELTFPDIKSVEHLMADLRKLDFKIGWDAVSRGDLFTRDDVGLIKSMKELGCESIAFSLESGSEEILKAINKRINTSDFIEQAKALWAGGVTPRTSVIFGYPQETVETIKRTIDICAECNIYPSAGFLLPLPGTQIYEWARLNGFIRDEAQYLESMGDRQDFHINLTKMPDEELVGTVEAELRKLAVKQGLKLESVLKTVTYQRPKNLV